MLDILGSMDWAGGFDELLPDSEVLDVGGFAVRVLTLEKLTEVKRHLSRPKDKFMLMHLEAALEEREGARQMSRIGTARFGVWVQLSRAGLPEYSN